MATEHDVVVIGGGPGGYAAALYGAAAGLDIGLVEMNKLGGTCLNVGCIPAKELLETAAVYRAVSESSRFGINAGEPTVDFSVTMERKQAVIDQLVGGLSTLLKHRKVTIYDGVGSLHPDRLVKVNGETELRGSTVILAAGSVPRTLPGFDIDGELVMTSDELLSIPELPETAAVIGGGAIGCEFASMMSDLGTKVTILEALPQILPGADTDVVRIVERSFKKRNIDIVTGAMVSGHEPHDGGTVVSYGDQSIDVQLVVMSIGRRPYPDHLGLDGTGVKLDERGFISVDQYCRTNEDGVYAIGDVIDTPQLAHVGFAEGILVIQEILGEDPTPVDYGAVPWCIYCHPEVAFAGHSEQSAIDAGYQVTVKKQRYGGNSRAQIVGETDGLVKVIAEQNEDGTAGRILGVHMAGPWVTEQLGQGYLAVNWEATVDEVAHFIQPHPTFSESFGETVLSLTGRGLHG